MPGLPLVSVDQDLVALQGHRSLEDYWWSFLPGLPLGIKLSFQDKRKPTGWLGSKRKTAGYKCGLCQEECCHSKAWLQLQLSPTNCPSSDHPLGFSREKSCTDFNGWYNTQRGFLDTATLSEYKAILSTLLLYHSRGRGEKAADLVLESISTSPWTSSCSLMSRQVYFCTATFLRIINKIQDELFNAD